MAAVLRLLLLSAFAMLLAPAASAAPGSVAADVAERVARDGRAPVIVELTEPVLPEGWLAGAGPVRAQRQRVVASQIGAIYDLGGTDAGPIRPYSVVPFLAVSVGPAALAALEASPTVRSVRLAQKFAPQLTETVPIVQGPESYDLGFDGTGQTIVVLDTGTDLGHDNFPAWKHLDEACFADGATGGSNPQPGGGDCPGGGDTAFGTGAAIPCDYHSGCYHGTHVAGIAVGNGVQRSGVAPGAGLIPIQVFSEFPASDPGCAGVACPLAWTHDTDAALLHVYNTLRLSHTIAAVNMSLGTGAYMSACDGSQASTKAVIDQLRSVGIATTISTGNNSCSGTGCTDAISAPACISSAVSVSATDDSGFIPAWANRATFMSILAPGRAVYAPKYNTTSAFQFASGTSMAAPHVAGAWAILRQAVPAGSVTSLLTALQDSGEIVHAPSGYERIQIRDALGLLGFPECGDGLDNDGDGFTDTADLGCVDGADLSELDASLECDDGIDNDSDGNVDLADDGCWNQAWVSESPACSDGIDNDSDGGIDYDGTPPDGDCQAPHQNTEVVTSSCGLGAELLLVLPLLLGLRRRR